MLRVFILFLTFQFIQIQSITSQVDNNLQIKTISVTVGGVYGFVGRIGQKFRISFDDLDGDQKDYYYKIIHCTQDWKPSNMVATDFIAGFSEGNITNVENSFNTLQIYTHYSFSLPNENTRVIRSGNYLVSVYNTNTDALAFSRRLVVYQPQVDVGVFVSKSRNVKFIQQKQTVQLEINHPHLIFNRPLEEINVVVFQNNDLNYAVQGLKPQYIRSNQLLYKYDIESSFWAGNEFLYFDTKTMRATSSNIEYVKRQDSLFHTYLYPTRSRALMPYTYNPDINGGFIIRTLDGENPFIESDYSLVHFTLKLLRPIKNKEVYIYGGFNNFEIGKFNRMQFDSISNTYNIVLPFKQGFYNYTYLSGGIDSEIDRVELEGSFYQTENVYTSLVYYKPMNERWYSIIGMGKAVSSVLNN